MSRVNIVQLAVVLVCFAGLLACNDNDEQQTATSKTSANKQSATQQEPEAKSDTDEDEEGAATNRVKIDSRSELGDNKCFCATCRHHSAMYCDFAERIILVRYRSCPRQRLRSLRCSHDT